MKKCVEEIIEYFSVDLNNEKRRTPAGDWLFETRKLQEIKRKNEIRISHNDRKRIIFIHTRKARHSNRTSVFYNHSQRTG